MAISPTGNSEEKSDLSEVKRKLFWRLAFAVLMILALLGGLALFDHFTARIDQEGRQPQFPDPVPVSKKAVTQALTPAEMPALTAKEGKIESEPESSAVPVDKSAPALEPPPGPDVSAQPTLPRAVTPAARSRGAAGQPSQARSPLTSTAPATAEPAVSSVKTPPAPPRLFSGYALQAGVFADPRRAEELHAKLTLEGIPSTIEARVQVGPFKSREQAEAARTKLKALGIDAVMLLPKGVKR